MAICYFAQESCAKSPTECNFVWRESEQANVRAMLFGTCDKNEHKCSLGELMDIRCRKTSCKFNDRYTCRAKQILIKKDLMCEQYQHVKGKAVDKTKWLFSEKPPEYAPQRDSATIGIGCNAHCLFNCNGKCVANGITLNDLKEKPLCVTFLRK